MLNWFIVVALQWRRIHLWVPCTKRAMICARICWRCRWCASWTNCGARTDSIWKWWPSPASPPDPAEDSSNSSPKLKLWEKFRCTWFIHSSESINFKLFFFNSYFFKIIINFYHYFIFTVAKNSSSTSSSIEFQTNSLNWFHSRWNTDWLDRSRIAPLPIGWPNTILHHSSTKERYTISRLRVLDTVSLLMSSVIRSIQFQFNINIHHGWTVIWMIRCLRPSQWQHHGEINGTPLSHRFRQVSGRCADVRQFQARSNAIRAHLGHGLRHQRWWQTFAKVPAFRRSVLSSKT